MAAILRHAWQMTSGIQIYDDEKCYATRLDRSSILLRIRYAVRMLMVRGASAVRGLEP